MMRDNIQTLHKIWRIALCGLLFLFTPAASAKTVVVWEDYRQPYQQPIHVFQHGEYRIESAEIRVNLPEEFARQDAPIEIVLELQSRTLSKQTKLPNFDSFKPYLKINSTTYTIPVQKERSDQVTELRITPKDLRVGENRFTATFRWYEQDASCSGTGCGYEIVALYFKAYSAGTSAARQHAGLDDLAVIFEEAFTTNANRWFEMEQPEAASRVHDGKLQFEHKRDADSWVLWNEIPFDSSRDFAISVTIRKISGVNDHGYGLIWGANEAGSRYQFLVAGNGFYKYEKFINNEWQELLPWTPSVHIKTLDAANTLAVRKAGELLFFFINDQWVGEAQFEPFFGNNIGFALNLNMAVECDDLMILQ